MKTTPLDNSVIGCSRQLPEGRKVFVALQDEDLICFELSGGRDTIGGVISLEQLLAMTELVEYLYDKRAKLPRTVSVWRDE